MSKIMHDDMKTNYSLIEELELWRARKPNRQWVIDVTHKLDNPQPFRLQLYQNKKRLSYERGESINQMIHESLSKISSTYRSRMKSIKKREIIILH